MRPPSSFNASFVLSTCISVAFHGAVIGVGFWFEPAPVPVAPPRPLLDHGENAITIVWRSPAPDVPTPGLEVAVPEEEEPLPREEPPVVTEPEVERDTEVLSDVAPEAAPRPKVEPVEETSRVDSVADVAPRPEFLRWPELARPVRDTTRKPHGAPLENSRLRPASLRLQPPEALFEEEPPSPRKPGVREEARLSSRLAPHYPRSCRRRGHQGTVRLECRLSAAGRVLSVRVLTSSGCERLDRAALEAVRPARFEPARIDGEPTGGTVVLPVEFRLR